MRTSHPSTASVAILLIAVLLCPLHAADEPKAPKGKGPMGGRGSSIERLHTFTMQLKLSEEQHKKIEDLFAAARQRSEALKSGGEAAKDPHAGEKIYDDLKMGVEGSLTPEQKKELRTEMAKGGNDPGAANGGPVTNLRENLEKVGLTPEQKNKIQDLVIEMKQKIGVAARGDGPDRGKKVVALSSEYVKLITALLTPEQKAKLDEITKSQKSPGKKGPPPSKSSK